MAVKKYLRTSDLARAVGAHPNTVRRYVEWGLLPPVERGPNDDRRFTQHHLDCLRVAYMIYTSTYAGRALRLSASQIIQYAVENNWNGALNQAQAHLEFVRSERIQAETATVLLEQWARGTDDRKTEPTLQIGQVAQRLGISIDVLRNWERNGFLTVPRKPVNGYREYSSVEMSRLNVIRLLTRAGYSHMAILRMLHQLDHGNTENLREALDTPNPDEDVYVASDRWLSTLAEQEGVASRLLDIVQEILNNRTQSRASL